VAIEPRLNGFGLQSANGCDGKRTNRAIIRHAYGPLQKSDALPDA
jgi:hypothetical protein